MKKAPKVKADMASASTRRLFFLGFFSVGFLLVGMPAMTDNMRKPGKGRE